MKMLKSFFIFLVCLSLIVAAIPVSATTEAPEEMIQFIKDYADRILYNENNELYPFLPNGFNIYSGSPVSWVAKDGTVSVPSSIMSHQYFFRLLDGLSRLTGNTTYTDYAKGQFESYMNEENLHDANGLFYAGNHRYYDIQSGKILGSVTNQYEHKFNFPYYELMFETDPEKAAEFVEGYWNAMVSDWENLLFSRHGDFNKEMAGDIWKHPYNESHALWLDNPNLGLSFINAGTDLIYSAVKYYQQTGNTDALTWAKRLWREYYRASDETTKILVYQYSKLNSGDRGLEQFINSDYGERALEGKVITKSNASSIYGIAVPTMVQLATELGDEEWLRQLRDSFEGFIQYAYNPETKKFRPILSDGTSLVGYTADTDGYYFNAGDVLTEYDYTTELKTGLLYVAFMTGSEPLWKLARESCTSLGDIGSAPGENVSLNLTTRTANPRYASVFLDLYQKTGVASYLELALKICDNMKLYSYQNGYYLRESNAVNNNPYINASVNQLAPLVTLKALAYALGQPDAVPDFPISVGGFLDDYCGETGTRLTDHDFTFKQTKSSTTTRTVKLLLNETYSLPNEINGHPVTWENDSDMVDTTKTGTFSYYGTSPDNLNCILIAAVVDYSYYEDFQTGKIPGEIPGITGTDTFRRQTKDDTGMIRYTYTDSEQKNIALGFHCTDAPETYLESFVQFFETYRGNDVEVGFRMKIDLNDATLTSGKMRLRLASPEGNSFSLVLTKSADGSYSVTHHNGLTPIRNAETVCNTEWVDFKYIFNLNEKTYDVYINGIKANEVPYTCLYDSITSLKVYGQTQGITAYIDDVSLKNSFTTADTGFITLKLAETQLNLEAIQGEIIPPQELRYQLMNADGSSTGLSVVKTTELNLDTSYVGTFSHKLDVDGEALFCTVTVRKHLPHFTEDFQGYTDEFAASGSRPCSPPYNAAKSPETDRVIFDTDGNKVIAITETGNRYWTRFNTGTASVGDKFDFAYRLKPNIQPENAAFKQFTASLANLDNQTNILAIYFSKNAETGKLSAKIDNTSVGEFSLGEWITVNGSIDIKNHTYTVTLNEEIITGQLDISVTKGAVEMRFGDRSAKSADGTYCAQHLLDELELNSYLEVSSVTNEKLTVYRGDGVSLPQTVCAVLSDGNTCEYLPVIWNESISTSQAGSYLLNGTVPNTAYTPTLTVNVVNLPYQVKSILMEDAASSPVETLSECAVIKGVTLSKISQSSFDGVIYLGIYHNATGKLLQIKACEIDSQTLTWNQGSDWYFPVNLSPSLPEAISLKDCRVNVFVFDTNMTPLAPKSVS